jgi:hypothetical protein
MVDDTILDRVFNTVQDKETSTQGEEASRLIHEWLDPKHVESKTRYTPQQVIGVAILSSLAETYNIKTLKRFLKKYQIGKLSEGGQSSSELENILKNRDIIQDDSHLKSLAKFLE